MFNIQLYL